MLDLQALVRLLYLTQLLELRWRDPARRLDRLLAGQAFRQVLEAHAQKLFFAQARAIRNGVRGIGAPAAYALWTALPAIRIDAWIRGHDQTRCRAVRSSVVAWGAITDPAWHMTGSHMLAR